MYCDYFIWCVPCTVVVSTCFVICGRVYVWVCNVWVCVCVDFVMCGCFDNCVGVLVIRVQ